MSNNEDKSIDEILQKISSVDSKDLNSENLVNLKKQLIKIMQAENDEYNDKVKKAQ